MSGGLWSGLNAATVFENGTYFELGVWDVEIVRCLSKNSQKSGDLFLVECEVLYSSRPDVAPGAKRTWCQTLKNKNVANNAVAAWLMAVFRLENDKQAREKDFFPYLEAFMKKVEGPENILSGAKLHLETVNIKTKEKGEDFTRHTWSPFDYASFPDLKAPDWYQMRPDPNEGQPLILSPDGSMRFLNGQWVPHVKAAPAPPPVQFSADGLWKWVNNQWVPNR